MTTLENKIDFAVIIRVTKANPNGDPLNGNRPRMDYDGFGEISDVCIKRKIRDRLMESKDEQGKYKYSVFVQSDERKTDDAKSLKDRADRTLKDNLTLETACKQWFDVRAFGQVFAFKADKSKKKKGDETDLATGILLLVMAANTAMVFIVKNSGSAEETADELVGAVETVTPATTPVQSNASNATIIQKK